MKLSHVEPRIEMVHRNNRGLDMFFGDDDQRTALDEVAIRGSDLEKPRQSFRFIVCQDDPKLLGTIGRKDIAGALVPNST